MIPQAHRDAVRTDVDRGIREVARFFGPVEEQMFGVTHVTLSTADVAHLGRMAIEVEYLMAATADTGCGRVAGVERRA